jgi:hypothetical protein
MVTAVPVSGLRWLVLLGTGADGIGLYQNSNSGAVIGRSITAGVATSTGNVGFTTSGSSRKFAMAWDRAAGTVRFCINGSGIFTLNGPLPDFDVLSLLATSGGGSAFLYGEIGPLFLDPASLPDARLQALTAAA